METDPSIIFCSSTEYNKLRQDQKLSSEKYRFEIDPTYMFHIYSTQRSCIETLFIPSSK